MASYFLFAVAYFLGAIPFAYLAGRFKHIDVRKHGSGNIGTTNAFRLLGPQWGIAVLLGDALKGALAAELTYLYFGAWGGIGGGLLAMAGHSWNPFFRFRPSGKGVASGLGIMAVLMPTITFLAVLAFLILVIATRYVSLGSAAGAVTVALSVLIFNEPPAYKVFGLVAASVVLIRHRTNFQRVRAGTEHRFGEKKR